MELLVLKSGFWIVCQAGPIHKGQGKGIPSALHQTMVLGWLLKYFIPPIGHLWAFAFILRCLARSVIEMTWMTRSGLWQQLVRLQDGEVSEDLDSEGFNCSVLFLSLLHSFGPPAPPAWRR